MTKRRPGSLMLSMLLLSAASRPAFRRARRDGCLWTSEPSGRIRLSPVR